jgi:hypothetical protein
MKCKIGKIQVREAIMERGDGGEFKYDVFDTLQEHL